MPVAPRILLVEDDAGLRALLATVLANAGYTVEEVAEGQAAVEALSRYQRHGGLGLLLLDMHLPGVDGPGVLQHLAALGSFAPVIAMSAYRGSLATARAAGARAVVEKPFLLDELLGLVARYCGS